MDLAAPERSLLRGPRDVVSPPARQLLAQPISRSWIFRVLHASEITRARRRSNAWCGQGVNAQISPMTLLNAAATGAMGLLAGMSLAQHVPDHAPSERSPLRGAAGFALPTPWRKREVVSGETKLIRLYRRDARLAGLRGALQAATLGTLLFASARA